MQNQQNISKNSSHSGGNIEFWRDEMVKEYDYQQSLLSEKKEEVLANITRIIVHFCRMHSIANPIILDIGCGPGTPLTLSGYVLEKLPNSIVVGVDSSDQMIEVANKNLIPRYGQRFSSYVSDFNSNGFWVAEINRNYDFIVSSGTLHYLSDQRRMAFFKEIFDHLRDNGVFVSCIADRSMVPEIAEMGHLFRVEFTYSQLEEGKRPQNFEEFKKRFEEEDKRANINWQSAVEYLNSIQKAGFRKADIVWHLWVKSIFVGIK